MQLTNVNERSRGMVTGVVSTSQSRPDEPVGPHVSTGSSSFYGATASPPASTLAPATQLPAPAPSGFRARISEALGAEKRNLYVASYRNRLVGQRIVSAYGSDGAYDYHDRSHAASAIVAALDNQGLAVFTRRSCARLAVDPKVQGFLSDLRAQLASATPQHPVQLWDVALKHAGSRDEAIRWLAVVFQDYSPRTLLSKAQAASQRSTTRPPVHCCATHSSL